MKINKIGSFVLLSATLMFSSNAFAESYPDLCNVLNRTMGQTTAGDDVKKMQLTFGQEGIAYLNITGTMNISTRKAVKIFQTRNSIYPSGYVGPLTLRKMRSLWCQNVSNQEVSLSVIDTQTNNNFINYKIYVPSKLAGNQVVVILNPDIRNLQAPNIVSGGTLETWGIPSNWQGGYFTKQVSVARAHEGIPSNGSFGWKNVIAGTFKLAVAIYPQSPFRPGTEMEYYTTSELEQRGLSRAVVAESGYFEILSTTQPLTIYPNPNSQFGNLVINNVGAYIFPNYNNVTKAVAQNICYGILLDTTGKNGNCTWNNQVITPQGYSDGTSIPQLVFPKPNNNDRLTKGIQNEIKFIDPTNYSGHLNYRAVLYVFDGNGPYFRSIYMPNTTGVTKNYDGSFSMKWDGYTISTTGMVSGVGQTTTNVLPSDVDKFYFGIINMENGRWTQTSSYVYLDNQQAVSSTPTLNITSFENVSYNNNDVIRNIGDNLSYQINYLNVPFNSKITSSLQRSKDAALFPFPLNGQVEYVNGNGYRVINGQLTSSNGYTLTSGDKYTLQVNLYSSSNQLLSNWTSNSFVITSSQNPPSTITVTPTNQTITSGQTLNMNLSTTNSNYCSLQGGIQGQNNFSALATNGNGPFNVSPTVTTTYTVSCSGINNQPAYSSFTVTVAGNTQANPSSFSILNPTQTVTYNPQTTFKINVQKSNLGACTVYRGSVRDSGVETDSYFEFPTPIQTTIYTITCIRNDNGQSISATATVNVNSVSGLNVTNFLANPITIRTGQNSNISFEYYNVKSCYLNGGAYVNRVMVMSGDNQEGSGVVGTFSINPTTTTTYTLSCSNNANQNISKTAIVNVTN